MADNRKDSVSTNEQKKYNCAAQPSCEMAFLSEIKFTSNLGAMTEE
jgi:hypothetical protein